MDFENVFEPEFNEAGWAFLPVFNEANGIEDAANLRTSSAVMAGCMLVVIALARLTYRQVPRGLLREVPTGLRVVFHAALILGELVAVLSAEHQVEAFGDLG